MCMCECYSWLRPFCKHLQVLWARRTHGLFFTSGRLARYSGEVTQQDWCLVQTSSGYKTSSLSISMTGDTSWWTVEQKAGTAQRRGDESGQRVTHARFLQPANQQQAALKLQAWKRFLCVSFLDFSARNICGAPAEHTCTHKYMYTNRAAPASVISVLL